MATTTYKKHGIEIVRLHSNFTGKLYYTIWVKGCSVQLSEDEYAEMLVELVGGEVTK